MRFPFAGKCEPIHLEKSMEVVYWLILNCAQPACFQSVILSCDNQEKVVLLLITLIKIIIKKINK